MYMDPARIKTNTVKLRFDDYENDLIEKYVNENGGQKAAILRDLVMDYIKREKQDNKNLKAA